MLAFLDSFTYNQIFYLILSIALILTSIIVFDLGKQRIGLIILILGTLVLGVFISILDPFLLLWDEQYHALVAKNLLNHPLMPTLYDVPVLPYDSTNWTYNHIWLHKQPLFLWQIALSLKVFGINTLAVRIPSILMHAIIPLLIYRIGKISSNAATGFYGALFFAVATYPLEMVAGRHATDHNDIAFLFYITASFWAWFEYQQSRKSHWLLIIGVLAGCAVLVKWLVGLIIYAVWFLTIGANNKLNWLKLKSYYSLSISFIISIIIFIPWQVYIFEHYPLEAAHEFEFNTKHFFQAIEDHGGDVWYHFNALKEIYGSEIILPFLILGLVILSIKIKSTLFRVAIISSILITYGFFTLAATKMTSFCIIVSPFVFLGLGALADSIFKFIQTYPSFKLFEKIFRPTLLITTCYFLIDFSIIKDFHTKMEPKGHVGRKEELLQMKLIHQLNNILKPVPTVVFNASVKANGYIETMFYTEFVAYDFIPNKEQIATVKQQSFKSVVIVKDSLPEFIMNDKDVIKVYFNK